MAGIFKKTLEKLPFNINQFFTSGNERTLQAKKNIAVTFLIKIGSVTVILLLVPLTIGFVNPMQYGIWLTLNSIIGWLGFFDIGLGNGLKNKLAEAVANTDYKLARIYVSTTYVSIACISSLLLVVFIIFGRFIDWPYLLNTSPSLASELKKVALAITFIICCQFILQLFSTICTALQNTRISSLVLFIGNLLGLIVIFIFSKISPTGNLLQLTLCMGLSPLLVLAVFSVVFFRTKYKAYAPSFKLFKLKYAKDILRLGIKFFYIQLGLIFFYNADNFIISHISGPAAITPYNIAFRYFGVITMISAIIMTPFWPAFTEAHIKHDHEWIKKTVKQLQKVCSVILLIAIIMVIASPYIYKVWVPSVHVPLVLSVMLAFYTVLNTYRTIFSYYANATGKINIQAYIIVGAGIINLPLGFFLGKLMGPPGVILSTILLAILCAVIEIMQYNKLINNKAHGMWNK